MDTHTHTDIVSHANTHTHIHKANHNVTRMIYAKNKKEMHQSIKR